MSTSERTIGEHCFLRRWIDLTHGQVRCESVTCADLEDLLGGIGRGFKLLQTHRVTDAYAPEAPLVLNLGVLSGTTLMTGLRSYFHAFSPLKRSRAGLPSAMWSAGSGKFGTKLRFLGIDELIITGRCSGPTLLHMTRPGPDQELEFRFEDASDLCGQTTHEKIQALQQRFPQAHFAVIGPGGEHYETVRYGAVALSTENQLRSGDAKARFCGRGGMGSIMGSKNLLALVADTPDGTLHPEARALKEINGEIGRGDGSRRFRDPRAGGLGGTWANLEALNGQHAIPEYNFLHSGGDVSVPLHRTQVERRDDVQVRAEGCTRCGIRCHMNLYTPDAQDRPGSFKAKIDYEPLNLLSSNLGIFDLEAICELIELCDLQGLDAISCGVTLAYAMDYNHRRPADAPAIAGGISFGDFQGARRAILEIGQGRMEALGRGTLRLSEGLGESAYAMQCKGMELPAYLPQTNPAYPWALAGGHMSMRTYLLLMNDGETGLDYWVDAITDPAKGLSILRDDLTGACKFCGLGSDAMAQAITTATGVPVDARALGEAVLRSFLRGYRLEKRQGFDASDYVLPERAHEPCEEIGLPDFITREFFASLRQRVLERFDELLAESGLEPC